MLVYSFDGSAIARKYADPVFESTTFPFCLFTGGDAAHKHVLELVERLREQFFGEAICREILVKNTINELWIEVYRQFSTKTVRPSDSKSAAQIQRLKNAPNFI